jgi:hypothetical protein
MQSLLPKVQVTDKGNDMKNLLFTLLLFISLGANAQMSQLTGGSGTLDGGSGGGGGGGGGGISTVLGTINQVTVVGGGATVTLSTPQDINVGASPTFVSGTFTGLLPSAYVRTDASSGLSSVVSIPFSDVTGIVPVAQGGSGLDASSAANGTFLIGNGSGFDLNVVSGTANQVIATPSAGGLTLSAPQDIHVGASPTFVSATFSGVLPSEFIKTDGASGLTSVSSIDLTTDVSNILPSANGGIGLDGSGAANGTFLIGNGTGFDLNVVSGTANQVIATPSAGGLTLSAPQDIHIGASPTFVSATFSGVLANEYLKTDGASGLTSVSSIPLSDLTGILPQDQGGTGFDAVASALDGQLLIGDTGTGFVSATVTGTLNQVAVTNGAGSITLSAPQDIHAGASPTFVSATFSGVLPSEFLKTDASSGLTSISSIDLTADISGVLPIANGGTNSSTALNDDRILVSSGGSIVEAAALTDGQLLIGSTGAAPVVANLTGTSNQVNIANTSGTVTFSLPQDIHTGASPTFLAASLGNIDVVGNVISSTNLNGNITMTPNGTGAVVISSDLQVSGDFITVSSSVMNVDNATIAVNVNGNQAAADVNDAGLIIVMSDATNSTIHYDSTLTSKFAAGDIGSTSEIVTVSDAQSITNKTLIQVDNLSLNGNTLSSSAGDIILDPTGNINFPDLTASLPLQLDASNNVIAAAIDFTNLTGIVPQDQGGTGLDASALANGEIFIGNGSGFVSATVTGTLNQVNVTNGAGSITLSAPQDIHVGASPTFVSATFSGVLANGFLKTNGASGLTAVASLDLTTDIGSSILPVANGGTNSSTALGNGRVLHSNSSGIVENSALKTDTTSAALDIDSTVGAFMPPRMTTGQRDALTAAAGMVLYNATINQLQYYNGTIWLSY